MNEPGTSYTGSQKRSALKSEVARAGESSRRRLRRRPLNGNGDRGAAVDPIGSFGDIGHEAALQSARALALERAITTVTPLRQAVPSSRDAVFRRLLALADMAAGAGALAVLASLNHRGIALASALSVPLIVLLAKVIGRYDHDEVLLRKSTLDEIPGLLALAAAYSLAWSLVTVAAGVHSDRAGVIILWGATSTLLVLSRSTARALAQLFAPPERVLIVGNANSREHFARALASDPGARGRVEVAGFMPLEDERRISSDWAGHDRRRQDRNFADLASVVRALDVHRVFLIPSSADAEAMLDAISSTAAVGVKVSIVPRLFEVVGSAVDFDTVGGVTVLGLRPAGLGRSSRAIKRATDVVGAGLGLILLAPFGALIALLIKLDSEGSVFFRQHRVGRRGRTFEMIKFRSMVEGAEAQRKALQSLNESDGIFKMSTDPRVTRVGRFLRRTSIDELPQLINVIRGDMSLVGPRPLVMDEDRLVEGRHRDRLQLAPGMTGPWQVLGPRRPPLSEMVKLDYLYATNWSLWSDVKILLRTMAHVFGQRGV